ncbi:kinase-like domain-containing protein [Rhizophagus irregularis DAOM 181602=DAOM 197198]|uniref:Kinase-like domain-containing protein n=2 Tax=Rhizophagus irregularis (strain DAOM 181602 / DAOM 197198 / MUCL 43194) TaxID=747089 RepID=A0A2H5RSE3_RHIID|nr:kinase-like domain-containing protein [Rhizophagus irregularis DAOM 181602=DAOM 197198]POG65435.1 kinase-like domain-containing protein [Rhizophagus irregularis DAOM 181602=DAOM 197198]|eukprot:XP_025172301.1 kinase-like domain-containing protein [Rhizophagus irregularis DAOM 181602=DAOM 197198]
MQTINDPNEWIEDAISKKHIKYYKYEDFRDVQKIGSGNFGKVYRANWKNLEQYFALKSLSNLDNKAIKEVVKEIEIHRDVHFHNNIISFFGITTKGESQNGQFKKYLLVMEYANADAVSCLHQSDIVHRDLHSGNILIDRGNIKLADFGLSRRIDEVSRAHSTNSSLFGIIPYIDPEKLRNPKYSLNKMSDVYSIGILLWEISSGHPPFKDESYDLSLFIQISQDYRETIVPGTPIDYSNLYTECWNGVPDNRPTMDQVVVKLKTTLANSNITTENDQTDKLNSKLQNEQQVNDNIPNTTDSVHGDLSQFINNFHKMDIKETTSPTTSMDVNENIFEEELRIVVDELVNHYLKEINEGKERNVRKQHIIDYVNNHNSQEMYNWLLNNQNNPNNIFILGYFKYHGIETNTDKRKAFELYQKATKLNNSAAQHELINIYTYEDDEYKNYDKAFELSKELAEKGYPGGISRLGYCYDQGIGTEININKAFELYQKAANLGHSSSQYNLADMYLYGDGVNKDHNKAFEYSEKSAEAGHSGGIRMLGYCYDYGIGTISDKQKAFELYQKAANLGNKEAQYSLAIMYEDGDGIEKDISQAIHWYEKSAEQGYQEAKEKLEKLI